MNPPTTTINLKQTILTCFAVFLLLVMCGCQLQRYNPFSRSANEQTLPLTYGKNNVRVLVNSQLPNVRPGRAVFVASGRGNGSYQTQRKILRELAVQFRSRGIFEVVVPDDLLLFGHSDNIMQGKFDETELAAVSRKYSADAVVIVRVNEFRSNSPMRIGVALAIIDSAESTQSLGAEGVWDLATIETATEFENFLSTNACADLHEQTIRRQAPTWLFQFSSSQMVEAIVNSGY